MAYSNHVCRRCGDFHPADMPCAMVSAPIGLGSKVRLKSGGPIMLVIDIPQAESPAACLCSWRDTRGEPVEASFFTTVLDHLVKARR